MPDTPTDVTPVAGGATAALTASACGGTAGREGLLQQVLRKSMGTGEEPPAQRPPAVLVPSNSLDRPRASQESPGPAAPRQAQPSPSTFVSTMKAALQEASEPRDGRPRPVQQPEPGPPQACQGPAATVQQEQQQQQARLREATPADQPLLRAGGGGGGWGTGTSNRSSDLDDELLARVMSAEQAAAARQQVGGFVLSEYEVHPQTETGWVLDRERMPLSLQEQRPPEGQQPLEIAETSPTELLAGRPGPHLNHPSGASGALQEPPRGSKSLCCAAPIIFNLQSIYQ